MTSNRIQDRIMTSSFTLPVVILICIAAWLIDVVALRSTTVTIDNFVLFKELNFSKFPIALNRFCNIALYILTGYLLVELNNRSDIIRVQPSVLTAVYYLFIAFFPGLHPFSFANLSLIAFILSLFFLFSSYQCRNSSTYLFHSFAMLGIGSLFFPQLIFFVPIWFIGSFMLQSLHIRSFFGGIIGLSLPYWILFTLAIYLGRIDIFYTPFIEIAHFGKMNIIEYNNIGVLLSVAFFIVFFLISSIHCLIIDYDNKIRTRIILHFVILLNTCLLLMAILQPIYEVQLLSLSLPGISLMTCHFFRRSSNRSSNIMFIIIILMMFVLYILNFISAF